MSADASGVHASGVHAPGVHAPSVHAPGVHASATADRIGWLHCLAGASGDMLLGALVDAGAPLGRLQAAVDAVGVDPVLLSVESVSRQGLGATKVRVAAVRTPVVRTWANIRGLLEAAQLPERVRAIALDAFARLAAAEAAVHRIAPEQVHFHEVGGLDAVADIVGVAAGLAALDLVTLHASPVALGSGMSRGEHGLLPIPAPAVLALLAAVGAPVYSGPAPVEMCTPTGAALLAATVSSWGPLPPMRVTTVGTGAGERDLDDVPNLVRLVLGQSVEADGPRVEPPAEPATVVAANVDDLDPRVWPDVLARLLAAGAADAWLTPVLMKKGRPAQVVSVLAAQAGLDAVRRVLFAETSTIGLREYPVIKRTLDREFATIDIEGQPVRIKIARLDGAVVNAMPEYDDVRAAALALGRPVKVMLAAAVAAASALPDSLRCR